MDGMPQGLTKYEEEKASGVRRASGAINLKRLTGRHLRVINYHLEGRKGYEIALLMSMSEANISKILTDPLAKDLIQKRFVEIDNEMYARSVEVVRVSMDNKDPAIALRSAEMVWRARGRFEKVRDSRPTAEDVVARMLEMARERGTASVTISAQAGDNMAPPIDPLIEGSLG